MNLFKKSILYILAALFTVMVISGCSNRNYAEYFLNDAMVGGVNYQDQIAEKNKNIAAENQKINQRNEKVLLAMFDIMDTINIAEDKIAKAETAKLKYNILIGTLARTKLKYESDPPEVVSGMIDEWKSNKLSEINRDLYTEQHHEFVRLSDVQSGFLKSWMVGSGILGSSIQVSDFFKEKIEEITGLNIISLKGTDSGGIEVNLKIDPVSGIVLGNLHSEVKGEWVESPEVNWFGEEITVSVYFPGGSGTGDIIGEIDAKTGEIEALGCKATIYYEDGTQEKGTFDLRGIFDKDAGSAEGTINYNFEKSAESDWTAEVVSD